MGVRFFTDSRVETPNDGFHRRRHLRDEIDSKADLDICFFRSSGELNMTSLNSHITRRKPGTKYGGYFKIAKVWIKAITSRRAVRL